jgi:adenylyltransferase/sulfurtransferase
MELRNQPIATEGGEKTMAIVPDVDTLPELTDDDLARYSRHIILPEVGIEGQRRLKAARVLCVGTGGLGSPLALYLAAAGVGTLGLVDFDVVDASNLQRQIIHFTPDIGRKKLDSAAEKLTALNPELRVVKHETRLTSANALEIIKDYDIVADGTDNFPTRYLVNDACVLLNKPNAYGSIFRFEGQASVFATEEGPCYRCLYPEPPPPGLVPSCAEGGVLGILPGLVGVIQATEVIKLILGKGETLAGRLLLIDALNMRFRPLKLHKNPDCPVCGTHRTITKLIDYEQFCGFAPETPQEKAVKNGIPQLSVKELKGRIDRGEDVYILDVREPFEYKIANLGGQLIPQNDVLQHIGEIDRKREVIVQCKSGGRSQKIAELLKQQGFERVVNLAGGITAWADEIDPTVKKY